MLSVENLACRRGRRQLFAELCFSLAAGEALEIAGSNGSGKTSLLRILAGLRTPEAGQVHGSGERKAYLAHEPGLKAELTLRENLHYSTQIAGADARQVANSLQRLGLRSRAEVPAARLSAGQRQRAALARVWLAQAPLWLLDEPCAHLDATGREMVETLLSEHVQGGGVLVFTTHQPLNLRVPVRCLRLGRIG